MEILFAIVVTLAIVGLGGALYRTSNRVSFVERSAESHAMKIESHEKTIRKLCGKIGGMARGKAVAAEPEPADVREVPKPELKLVRKYGDPEFSLRLKNIMERKGISQDKIAEELGVTINAVWNWTHGYSTPRAGNIELLAIMLDVDSNYLMNGDPRAKAATH